ncbi:ATP-dependent DNA helicase RecG [Rosettibacter firmus]|uniref:ATP-dependent DNA helicase RecG n=1 Tax=Rosettibacter firmus TaxID=3111522 RepID=UPI00336BFD31
MSENLSTSVQYLKSVGPKRAEAFSKIGINTIKDLLFYFPSKYLDRSNILNCIKIVQYVRNGYQGEVTIIGEVINKELIHYGKKNIFKVRMKDSTGIFECVWFQGIKYFTEIFNEGDYFAISAKPVLTKYGNLQFVHPDFDRISKNESLEFLHTGKIIPFYRVPKELREKNLGDFSLRKIIHQAVEKFSDLVEETLPQYILKEKKILPLNEAIKNIHFPSDNDSLTAAKRRLKFEELFYFECLVALRKSLVESKKKNYKIIVKPEPIKKFLNSLPFQLTKAQLKVLHEIRKDLESSKPMNRLLQGDVGSGKTIVALIAMLIVVTNGYQAILMAPTEILADQHFKNISRLIKDLNIKVSLLIGGQKKYEREKILKEIKNGDAQIIIGTHALIEENVDFHKVGLVVIDEQHRFGVIQRSELIKKGINPDVLIMTATPIPRTLSLTLYGDLDVSTIDEMPANRKPIKTVLRGESKLPEIYKFIQAKAKEGYQTFLVYPLIEDSEKMELKAAETYYNSLKETHLKDLRLALIHGRMKWQEKEKIMLDFAAKKYDVLVSTTVIEVGIDIPDANIIVINDAFRFGLSQLHQLRGRVGRSDKQAYCILVTKDEFITNSNMLNINFEYLSPAQIEKSKTIIRLNSMVRCNNGFELSEIDLKLRGPGDIFGTKQSGLPDLKYSDISEDVDILYDAKEIAFNIIKEDPKLNLEKNFIIKKVLKENYHNNLLLSQIA